MMTALFLILFVQTKSYILLFFFIWLKFMFNSKNLILSMLVLEMNMLAILMTFIFLMKIGGTLLMAFVTVTVCEAVFGLGLLIYTSRYKKTELIYIN